MKTPPQMLVCCISYRVCAHLFSRNYTIPSRWPINNGLTTFKNKITKKQQNKNRIKTIHKKTKTKNNQTINNQVNRKTTEL